MSLSHWYTQVTCSRIFSYPFLICVAKCIIVIMRVHIRSFCAWSASFWLCYVVFYYFRVFIVRSLRSSYTRFRYTRRLSEMHPPHIKRLTACICWLVRSLIIREKAAGISLSGYHSHFRPGTVLLHFTSHPRSTEWPPSALHSPDHTFSSFKTEKQHVLVCDAMYSSTSPLTFRKNLVLPFSGSNCKPRKQRVRRRQQTEILTPLKHRYCSTRLHCARSHMIVFYILWRVDPLPSTGPFSVVCFATVA